MATKQKTRDHLLRLMCFLLPALAGSGCDLHSKAWAEETLGGAGTSMMVIEPWLEFSLTYNRGTAFSMIGDLGTARLIFGISALVMAVGMLLMVLFWRSGRFEALSLGIIAGGAVGNGFDRIFRLVPGGGTGVIDFIKFNYPWGGSWPTFNVADALVFCGVAIFLLQRLLSRRAPEPASDQPG